MDINARQIGYLEFNYLDQSETYQYSVDQLSRVKACAPLMAKLGNEVGVWETATQTFDTAYRKSSTEAQTKTLKTIDDERDSLYSGLVGTINNATKSPIAAQATAATDLLEPIKRYDVKTGGEYQQETMRIDQFCQDLLANYTSQLTTLGLTEWTQALQAKNLEFQEAMRARTDDQAGFVKSELSQLRQQMIAAFNAFRKLANVIFIYEGDTAYATTIDQMNAEVRHYKQIIARKGGGSSSSSSGSGGTASPDPSQGGTASPDPSQGGGNEGGGGASPDPSQGGENGDTPGTGGDSGGGDDNGDDNNGPIGDAE
ncbi:MAG: hypothetical protein IK144_00580 [Bacteroidaceae bacterium]|nr:hypothetical protein [Bacteroidaceae bacterium]